MPNPVTAEVGMFKTHLSEDGHFHFEVPIESNTIIGIIGSDLFDHAIKVALAANGETKLEITHNESDSTKADMINRKELTSDDVINLVDIMGKMIDHQSPERIPRYNMLIEDFIPYEIKSLERKLNIANNDSIISKNGKSYSNLFILTYAFSIIKAV